VTKSRIRPRAILLTFLAAGSLLLAASAAAQGPVLDPCQAGQKLFQENDHAAAEPLLLRCLEQGESLQALLPLAMIATVEGRTEAALGYGTRALALGPDNVNVRYWYGRALAESGDHAQAQAQWEEGLALDASHAGILEGLALLNIERGQHARAYNLLHQLRLQGVDEGWLHRQLSGLARRKGQWEQAVAHWRDMMVVEGESAADLVVLGELTILAGKSIEAVAVFQRAVDLEPSGATYGGLGEAWFTCDQIDSAAVALQQAVALEPDNPRHRFNLANASELLDQVEQAAAQFRAYLDLRPEDPVGRFHYGVHLERRGRPEAAVAQLEEAVRLDPEYRQAMVVLASLHEVLGQNEAALELVDRLHALDPDSSAELGQWRQILLEDLEVATAARAAGKVHLLHILTGDPQAVDPLRQELAAGQDFAELATRYSEGPTAVRGGDIGWVDPAQMLPTLRDVIVKLAPGETSPPVVVGGQTHVFKRVR
jgi:tetratricopeptide (TPR) repeat protein